MVRPRSPVLRIGRRSEAGRVYLVTFTTYQRRRWFLDWDDASCVADAVASHAVPSDAQLLCWGLMPDHFHGVIELGSGSLPAAVGRLKARATRRWHQRRGSREDLWAKGFHDRALRQEADLLPMARYIIANPVRAGLVKRAGDYPFWNAVWL